jgi:hypothetical protein
MSPSRLTEGLEPERVAPPAAIVIFGASGDLTTRKLMPALRRLARRGELPAALGVVGVARTELDDEGFRQRILGEGGADDPVWSDLVSGFRYVAGEYSDPETFKRLTQVLDELDESRGTGGNRLYYLATPPSTFPEVVAALGNAGMNTPGRPGAFVRIVVEKPYGRDLASALALDQAIHEVFTEEQIYRGRRQFRTSWPSGSPTRSSSRSGTGPTSITSRSRRRRPRGWVTGAASTRRRAPCATSCRTTSCRCWPSR